MLEHLKYERIIEIDGIPIQWLPKLELYYPDLPGFPIVYIHKLEGGKRLYGSPLSISFSFKEPGLCNARITFITNSSSHDSIIKSELKERFGMSQRIGLNDLLRSCNGSKEYESFFKELWKYVSKTSGSYVPFGRFYEEIYSIVRFVSAWRPRTGRQSEMRMLYNFFSTFGEKIETNEKWSFVDFHLLPTYDDLLNESLNEFPKFKKLLSILQKIWPELYKEKQEINGIEIRSMPKGSNFGDNRSQFSKKITEPLVVSGIIDDTEKHILERLVDVFNRHPGRTSYFIWSIMTPLTTDYRSWDKSNFIEFYLGLKDFRRERGFQKIKGIGISPKAVACFLQQGFGKAEIIPIDTWVETFHKYALGINDLHDFFREFSSLGKVERIIWLSAQSRKTNMKQFFEILWCLRYGDNGNTQFREANPISCYECKLRNKCPGYSRIKEKKVMLVDRIDFNNDKTSEKKKAYDKDCTFICATEKGVPKEVHKMIEEDYVLIDEFSGYLTRPEHKLKKKNKFVTVDELIEDLPLFTYEDISIEDMAIEV